MPSRGLSSAGRAPALQAGGHRFDPDRLHQALFFSDGNTNFQSSDWCAGFARIFDIVNGFLIDAVAHGFLGLRTGIVCGTQMIIWLRLSSAPSIQRRLYAGLSLMVWILKREVRAFGGCLGMYRRRRTWHAAISVGEL